MKVLKRIGFIVLLLLVLVLIAGVAAFLMLRASLPALEGEIEVSGLTERVTVERDGIGIPTITAANRVDLARALGFVHAQDRFFQMDLLRRQPAGELSELFGPRALDSDRRLKVHRFRTRAIRALQREPHEYRQLFDAYAAGVNAGLDSLGARPFEYYLIPGEPTPWRPEDTLLVVYAIYLDLQDETGRGERSRGILESVLDRELFEFLTPDGSEWDSTVDGSTVELPTIPERVEVPGGRASEAALDEIGRDEAPGSNNFAVSGALTEDGRAIVAGDMHLGLSLPNIWYQVAMKWEEGDETHRLTGVSLPGAPVLVAGSNHHVAWTMTNSRGDWVDLVALEQIDAVTYQTPEGPRNYEVVNEVIEVAGEEDETVEILETIWGPVIETGPDGTKYALSWVAHHPEAVNMRLREMESARTVADALEELAGLGIPGVNMVVADSAGTIGWTLGGAIPRRDTSLDRQVPLDGTDPRAGWSGWLEPHEFPVLRSPEYDRIWTANSRVVGGEMLELLGDGGYVLGARADQIQASLEAKDRFTEEDLLAIQLDDRAIFLDRWWRKLRATVEQARESGDPRPEVEAVLDTWDGRASISSAAYRLVRGYRQFLERRVFEHLTRRAEETDPEFEWVHLPHREHVLWTLVEQEPPHLLPEGMGSWHELEIAALDEIVEYFAGIGPDLGERTWGERNTANIGHPLAGAIPILGRGLLAPATPLPGDSHMPRVQGTGYGASQRMVVSPGREEEGFAHMPGGQSGHPLSPFFLAGHEDWEQGNPTPFLPGETRHTLTLTPGDD